MNTGQTDVRDHEQAEAIRRLEYRSRWHVRLAQWAMGLAVQLVIVGLVIVALVLWMLSRSS